MVKVTGPITSWSGSAADNRSSSPAANGLRPPCPSESPGTTVAAHNDAAATAGPPQGGMPIPAHLQSTVDEYQRLLGVKGNTYMGYIDGEHQYRQYLAAQELVTHHGGEGGDLTFDYPNNKHGQEEIAKRLFNAIVNLEEPQDHFAETGDFAKSLGVKAVKNLTSIEVELLALRFKNEILKCQRGEPVVTLEFPVKQEANYMTKLNEVVKALSGNKLLCRSAISGDDWIARIVADPDYHRNGKITNLQLNARKKGLLKKAMDMEGAALVKGSAASPQQSDKGQS